MTFYNKFFFTSIVTLFFSCVCVAEQLVEVQELSLRQAIQLALDHNHDLKLSLSAVENATAAGLIAGAAPNPMLTLQATGINPKEGIGAGPLCGKAVDSAMRIDQLIERGGKRQLRMTSTAYMEDAARADKHDMQRQVRVLVSLSYYDLLAAEEKHIILTQTAALYEHSISAAQKRQKAGDLAGADLARLQVDALRAKNDVVQSVADTTRMRQILANALGQLRIAEHIKLTDTWPPAIGNFTEPSLTLLDSRPEIKAAKARVDAALANRKLALASRSRDVSVGVQYDHYPVGQTNNQGTGNSVGFFIQIPLFLRYQFEGEIRSAEVAVDVATETLEKIRDQVKNDLFQNWQDVRTSFDLLQRYDDSLLIAAKKSADAAEFAFAHGAINIMDVLDTRRLYKATQLDALSARAVYAKSLAAWQANPLENEHQ